jgi:hypothetical protein
VTLGTCGCGVTHRGGPGQAYNEEAFRHLLDTERRRAERSRRAILLLLVSIKKQPAASDRSPPAAAARIFCGLWACVREADFIGWFREDRVAGAVLVQGADRLELDVPARVGHRTAQILLQHAPAVTGLHVRVLQLRSARKRQLI